VKKNPSDITLARRAVDQAILAIAKLISERLAQKWKPNSIACFGLRLDELSRINDILVRHEQGNKRTLSPQAIREIGSIIESYEVVEEDKNSWFAILKPMVGQGKV